MPQDNAHRQTRSSSTESEEGGLFATLLTTAPGLLDRYHSQLMAIRNTFRLELVLNLKCGLIVLLFAVVLGCVLLSSWLGLNALLFFGLTTLDAPLWSIAMALAALHVVALASLYRAIKSVFSQMGFSQILELLGASSPMEEGDSV